MIEDICLVGLSISAFTMLTVFTRSKVLLADKILGLWLFFICIPMLEILNIHVPLYNPLFNLLHGPLLFFYVRVLIQGKPKFEPIDVLHLAPFVLIYLLSIGSDIPNNMVPGVSGDIIEVSGIDIILVHFGLLNVISFLLYSVVVTRLLIQHRQKISSYFSRKDTQISLSWIFSLPLSFFAITLLNLLNENGLTQLPLMHPLTLHIISHCSLAILLCFFGVKQKPVFEKEEKLEQQLDTAPAENELEEIIVESIQSESIKPKTQQTDSPKQQLVDSDVVEIYKDTINQYMLDKQAYLDPDFSVYILAEALDIPRRTLSYVLSSGFNKNFYQFVNGYRLQEMQSRLSNSENRDTILDIGFACGFSSKSTYNSLFKKQCGCTPTQYRKLALKGEKG